MKTTMTDGQMIRILQLLKEKGMNPDALQVALANGTLADFLEAVVKGPIDRNELRKVLGLPNLDDKLKELIALGKYDWVNIGIVAKHFPVAEIPQLVDEKIYHVGKGISSEAMIAQMDKDGYRPATMAELLVYGAKNPEEQRKYPIVALGSVALIDGHRGAGFLYGVDSRRKLDLNFFDYDWSDNYRFLAVRK